MSRLTKAMLQHEKLESFCNATFSFLGIFYPEIAALGKDAVAEILVFGYPENSELSHPIIIEETCYHEKMECKTKQQLSEFIWDHLWLLSRRTIGADERMQTLYIQFIIHDLSTATVLRNELYAREPKPPNNMLEVDNITSGNPEQLYSEIVRRYLGNLEDSFVQLSIGEELFGFMLGTYKNGVSLGFCMDQVAKTLSKAREKFYLDINSENGISYLKNQRAGNTTLTYYVVCASNGVCDFLLKSGADPYLTDMAGKNAILLTILLGRNGRKNSTTKMVAAGGGWGISGIYDPQHHLVHMMLAHENTAKHVNDKMTRSQCTALHAAAARGNGDIIKALIKVGADPTIKDARGMTVIDVLNMSSAQRKKYIIHVMQEGFEGKENNLTDNAETNFGLISAWYKDNEKPICTERDIILWHRQYQEEIASAQIGNKICSEPAIDCPDISTVNAAPTSSSAANKDIPEHIIDLRTPTVLSINLTDKSSGHEESHGNVPPAMVAPAGEAEAKASVSSTHDADRIRIQEKRGMAAENNTEGTKEPTLKEKWANTHGFRAVIKFIFVTLLYEHVIRPAFFCFFPQKSVVVQSYGSQESHNATTPTTRQSQHKTPKDITVDSIEQAVENTAQIRR